MRKIAIFLCLLGFGASCTQAPEPAPLDLEQLERDSLLTVYGKTISTPDLEYLHYFQQDKNDNSLLYGGTSESFWFGVFRPDRSKVMEQTMNLNAGDKIVDPISYPVGFSYRVLDKLLFEIHTIPKSEKDNLKTGLARTIMGLSESHHELLGITEYLEKDNVDFVEKARPWKGGYLLEHSGIFSANAKDFTQFISTDFKESIRWDCISPESPRIGVYYFEKDLFVDVIQNGVWGFNYSTCSRWAYNILDFFGKETCPGCISSIKLKSQQDGIFTLEVSLNDEIRTVVIDYRTGALISNG